MRKKLRKIFSYFLNKISRSLSGLQCFCQMRGNLVWHSYRYLNEKEYTLLSVRVSPYNFPLIFQVTFKAIAQTRKAYRAYDFLALTNSINLIPNFNDSYAKAANSILLQGLTLCYRCSLKHPMI